MLAGAEQQKLAHPTFEIDKSLNQTKHSPHQWSSTRKKHLMSKIGGEPPTLHFAGNISETWAISTHKELWSTYFMCGLGGWRKNANNEENTRLAPRLGIYSSRPASDQKHKHTSSCNLWNMPNETGGEIQIHVGDHIKIIKRATNSVHTKVSTPRKNHRRKCFFPK